MTTKLDYEGLRAQTIQGGSDQAVTVNTRALIDKVLARYSGEWTTLRELLQNAADASATRVIVRFQTQASAKVPVPQSSDVSIRLKHVISNHTLKSLIIENNGIPFQPKDWSRLQKIAEGNPDETKIGAFGVGFYSVFADCEEPFVTSGTEALAFYWKGDSLSTRKLSLGDSSNKATTFFLPMRNPTSPVPSLMSLSQFLASSLVFVGLNAIELWLDDWKVVELNKISAPTIDMKIPSDLDRITPDGIMQLRSATQEPTQLDARWLKVMEWKPTSTSHTNRVEHVKVASSTATLRTFFSRLAAGPKNSIPEKPAQEEPNQQNSVLESLDSESRSTIFLHVNKANISTSVTQNFSDELNRATKKPPPKMTTVALLAASYDEHIASTVDTSSQIKEIFGSVLPEKGKIYIGFSTNQSKTYNP